MRKHIWISTALIIVFAVMAYFLVITERVDGGRFKFRFGLDLEGGAELVYKADTRGATDVEGSMESLKEVVERRIGQSNLSGALGALEPLIQTESAGIISGNRDERLIVELPGVTNIDEAIALIGKTPILEFRLVKPGANEIFASSTNVTLEQLFYPAELTGQFLERATVMFDPNTNAALVSLNFNDEGRDLFARITRENKGEILAILLDNAVISAPVIVDEITTGEAQITGDFTPDEARELVRNLNYGALPLPIELVSSQTVGATLGEVALNSGLRAGVIGFIVLSIFLVLWYRVPGFIAVVALVSYTILSLAIFKLIPVTLTAAGVAGFILSLGMAVDANVLIFERMKEELKKGRSINDALHEGFHRAWLSIRDSNISSIITAIILFWLGTSAVKGFALTLGIGVLVSMFTAISLSRTLLFAVAPRSDTSFKRFLFSNGLHK